MTQDQLNKELDFLLEELIFNGDIVASDSPAEMKRILLSLICDRENNHNPIDVSEEQWRAYAVYCLQSTVEGELQQVRKQLIQ